MDFPSFLKSLLKIYRDCDIKHAYNLLLYSRNRIRTKYELSNPLNRFFYLRRTL